MNILASCVVSGLLTILFQVHILSTCDLTWVSHLLHNCVVNNLGWMMNYKDLRIAAQETGKNVVFTHLAVQVIPGIPVGYTAIWWKIASSVLMAFWWKIIMDMGKL